VQEQTTKLTERDFWEDYWAGCKLPSTVDMAFSFERCLALQLEASLRGVSGEVLEIGCAPGRWLVFLAKETGLKPSGIEYASTGMAATMRNLEVLGVAYGFIEHGDFFALEPIKKFDVVMSLGFIEHFSNVEEVIERHLAWLKPGGMLVLGIPNFRGIYTPLQAILDQAILDKHNLEIMDLAFFRGLSHRHHLSPRFLDYIGSFEPDLPIPPPRPRSIVQTIVVGVLAVLRRVRRLRFFDRINSRFFSSYILAVYTRVD